MNAAGHREPRLTFPGLGGLHAVDRRRFLRARPHHRPGHPMRSCLRIGRFVGIASLALIAVATAAAADEQKIALCHAGLITLPPFAQLLKERRASPRDTPEEIEKLVERNRKGGVEFFSSQIIIQEEISGSGTFDLRREHGLNSAKYRNVTAWDCQADDYPIVYFVGFRVRKIEDGAIFVSREKDIVNVISLKALDPGLDKHLSVKIFEGDKVLCRDLGSGCDDGIFYDRN
jgi:hypothetical protein